jgi:hypothetical protein
MWVTPPRREGYRLIANAADAGGIGASVLDPNWRAPVWRKRQHPIASPRGEEAVVDRRRRGLGSAMKAERTVTACSPSSLVFLYCDGHA